VGSPGSPLDYEIVWDVVRNKIPALVEGVRRIVEAEENPEH